MTTPAGSALVNALVELAGTPDDTPDVDTRLARIVQETADRLASVSYASITALRDGATVTVAASSEVAVAVDRAQYAEAAGPCLDALAEGAPVGVPDIAATMAIMAWPGFQEAAFRMGLRASVSIPLFAGSGMPIAALNLYSRDPVAMAPLSERVLAIFRFEPAAPADPPPSLDSGGEQLLAGLSAALAVRDLIQQAIGVLMARERRSADEAYLALRLRAADTGSSLTDAATALTARFN
jgi:hypothetical protein